MNKIEENMFKLSESPGKEGNILFELLSEKIKETK